MTADPYPGESEKDSRTNWRNWALIACGLGGLAELGLFLLYLIRW